MFFTPEERMWRLYFLLSQPGVHLMFPQISLDLKTSHKRCSFLDTETPRYLHSFYRWQHWYHMIFRQCVFLGLSERCAAVHADTANKWTGFCVAIGMLYFRRHCCPIVSRFTSAQVLKHPLKLQRKCKELNMLINMHTEIFGKTCDKWQIWYFNAVTWGISPDAHCQCQLFTFP